MGSFALFDLLSKGYTCLLPDSVVRCGVTLNTSIPRRFHWQIHHMFPEDSSFHRRYIVYNRFMGYLIRNFHLNRQNILLDTNWNIYVYSCRVIDSLPQSRDVCQRIERHLGCILSAISRIRPYYPEGSPHNGCCSTSILHQGVHSNTTSGCLRFIN